MMDRAPAQFPKPHHARRYDQDRIGRRVPWPFGNELLEAAKGGRPSRSDGRSRISRRPARPLDDGLLEIAKRTHLVILPSRQGGSHTR